MRRQNLKALLWFVSLSLVHLYFLSFAECIKLRITPVQFSCTLLQCSHVAEIQIVTEKFLKPGKKLSGHQIGKFLQNPE